MTERGDSAVVRSGRVWIDPEGHGDGEILAQYPEAVKVGFDAEGIDMPYPNTDRSVGIPVSTVAPGEGAAGD